MCVVDDSPAPAGGDMDDPELQEVWGNYVYLVSVQRDNHRLREEIMATAGKPSLSRSVSAHQRYSGY
jgi:hypothetical protein